MSTKVDEEKRAHPRVDFEGRTVVFVGDQQVVCKGSNLSAGGMLLVAPLAAPVGQTLKLALSLQPSQWLNLEARVVRQAQDSSAVAWGLEFVRVSAELAATLAGYVAGRLGAAAGSPAPARKSTAAAVAARTPTGPAHPAVPAKRRPEVAPSRPVAPGRTPTAPGHPKAAAAPEPAGSGLFSRLKNRISAAWTGDAAEKQPDKQAEPAKTGYALGRDGKPAVPARAAPAARGKPRRGAPSGVKDVEPIEDVPEDVLPHDDILGDADKILSGKDRKLHRLYSAALRDVSTDVGDKKK